ncbi:MAG: HigA family addiction module antitoxin [Opitutaceae bacterium]|nr:HigA family addiction module antitoxin [Opitutaceae bacterium]
MSKHINVHPGELLREEFLKPMGITPYRLAKDARLPNQRVHEIVNEKRGITAETDLHLCAFFGLTPGYWLKVQLAYELRQAINTIGRKVLAEVRPLQAAGQR